MKRTIAFFLLLIVLVLAGTYLFVPGSVRANRTATLVTNAKAFARVFPETQRWTAWWPGDKPSAQNPRLPVFEYNGRQYRITQPNITSLQIQIAAGSDTIPAELFFIPLSEDSLRLEWNAAGKTSLNPATRIKNFTAAKALEGDMAEILQRIRSFYQKEENIYGVRIEKSLVNDSILLATRFETEGYPSTEAVYTQINKLREYASAGGAAPSGHPMLSVFTQDSVTFRTQVALPVNKRLPDKGDIAYRWMLGGGNILVAEVRGGNGAINNAFAQLELYVNEHRRTAPAIPFQSLVTDRRSQPDTSKWITKLYWPVM